MGNYHAGFLGENGAEKPLPYPVLLFEKIALLRLKTRIYTLKTPISWRLKLNNQYLTRHPDAKESGFNGQAIDFAKFG